MLRNRNRAKLINAIVFFARNTQRLGKIKLFKLLYLMDFEHFQKTGRAVTGLEYRAWKFGPVPTDLMQEWEELEPDLAAAIDIQPVKVIDYVREGVFPKVDFDESHFTTRELRIMEALAREYDSEYSPRMIDVTHAENGAWAKVWNEGQGQHDPIPYELSLPENGPHREMIMEAAREYDGISRAQRR